MSSSSNVIISQIAEKLRYDSRVLVAFSGGVDSSVLLHALIGIRDNSRPELEVRAVYVHHGLSHFADDWAEHCQAQCQRWQVEFHVVYVQVDSSAASVEAAAREARYQAIGSLLTMGEVLVTAQHLDDQCETFLLALKRGSGPAGLSAMPERIGFMDYHQVRPLLNISRHQIEDYARHNNLRWIEDESNQNDRFDRNFLRLRILPEIQQRWPQFAAMVSRSAELCAQQETLLDDLLAPILREMIQPDGAIHIAALADVSDIQRGALLRRWFHYHQVSMPSRSQLERLWFEVALSRPDAEPLILLGDYQIRRYRQWLYLLPVMPDIESAILTWDGLGPLVLPDNLGQLIPSDEGIAVLPPDDLGSVTVRFTARGSYSVHVVGHRHSRPLKKIWQELSVPPWQRQRIPLLFYGETLIAAVGLFVTVEGQPKKGQPVWRIGWKD
ncbi:tRNA lysidine(34) synthetase TilS [Budvicia diplopodorum]|uniref:tRNA lysidine(34) synthetase TilS n=1 Tax=Budvicia diplopodorum TaxID=1119056 RepID=UPI00135A2317|nr:tRNA lysidine(34) synthetase TilS [Budvicia diplopodorum]